MLNLGAKRKETLDQSRPFSELVPWALRLTDSIILNKDESLMMVYRIRGVDPDTEDRSGHEQIARAIDQAWRLIGERGMIWTNLLRRRLNDEDLAWWDEPSSNSSSVNSQFRRTWRKGLIDRRWYSNEVYLALLLSPESDRSAKYLEQVGVLTTEEDMPIPKALVAAMRSSVMSRGQYASEARRMVKRASELQAMASQVSDLLAPMAPRLLEGDELEQALHDMVSPVNRKQPVSIPAGAYLDTELPDCELDASGQSIVFQGAQGERHAICLSVKAWPERTYLQLLDALGTFDGELTYSVAFRMTSHEKVEKAIRRVKSYHSALQVSFKNYIKQAFGKSNGGEPVADRPQHIRYTKEADVALSNLSKEQFGYLHLSIVCYGETVEQSEALAGRVSQLVQRLGFIVIRETLHALSSWTATLPGQWAESVRWRLMTAANYTDLFPGRVMDDGGLVDQEFTEQTGTKIGPLGVFPTRQRSLYRFLPTVRGVGHTIVVGPTGAGKSTIMNFLIAQWLGYENARVYIFDQKYSCRVPVTVQGGRYIDLAGEQGDQVTLNPLSLLEDENEIPWVVDWVQGLMESRGQRLNDAQSQAISEAVQQVQQISRQAPALRTLSKVRFMLPAELRPLLSDWTFGIGDEKSNQPGRYAKYFDNPEDQFDISSFVGVELGLLARQAPRVAVAALEYMDRRIRKEMDGSPVFIYIEEAWFALADPHFLARIETWLRTLRSLNGVVYLATQSLTEIAESEKFSLLLDSIPNRIYLPNANAATQQRDLYMKKFGLNSSQVGLIANAQPRKDYYIAREGIGHLVSCGLGGWLRDMVRSDSVALSALDTAMKEGGDISTRYFKLVSQGR